MTTPSEEEARAAAEEAHERYDGDRIIDENTGEWTSHDDWGYSENSRQAFVAGAAWALASRVSTPPSEEADEIRSEAVRETKRYIDRIHRNGLVPLGTVLADMEAAAYRMEQGMTARGSTRRPPVPAVPVLPAEPEEPS